MEMSQLTYFKAVAQYGSFTKAADALHVTQSALSRSIGALEQNEMCIRDSYSSGLGLGRYTTHLDASFVFFRLPPVYWAIILGSAMP